MQDVVGSTISGRLREPDGLRKMIVISVGAHIAFTAALVLLPSGWLQRPAENPHDAMFISLGGTPGPASGGMTPISARPVQKAMQDLPKVTPTRPPAAKTPEMTLPDPESKVKPKPTTPVKEAPKEARGKTPTTGQQEVTGKAMAQTQQTASTNAVGLSTGGGGTGGQLQLANFCCPEYVGEMVNRINQNWNPRQSGRYTTVMHFTIQRDGRITDIAVQKSSGYQQLDFLAQRALLAVNPLPPLPQAYTNPTLVVNLNFDYQP
jgi:TonB family protein